MGDFLIGNVSTGFCKGGCAAIIDSGTSLLAGPTKKLAQMEKEVLVYESIDLSRPNIANELKEYLKHHELPLGKDSRTAITEMMASVGHSCEKSMDLLSQYMSYKVNGPCPDDWSLGQKLILRGCEPLPRRRCFAKTTPKVAGELGILCVRDVGVEVTLVLLDKKI